MVQPSPPGPPPHPQEPIVTRPQPTVGISDFSSQGTPCAQLPEGSSVIQMLENPLCSLKSTFDTWLNTSSTVEVIND